MQLQYNLDHNITPQSIIKPIDMNLVRIAEGDYVTIPVEEETEEEALTPSQREKHIAGLEVRMRDAARKFEFDTAAKIRDKIRQLRLKDVAGIGIPG